MAPRETEDNGYAKVWGEHYGMLWYFLEWSILYKLLFSIAHGNMLTSQGNRKHYGQTPLIRTLRGP